MAKLKVTTARGLARKLGVEKTDAEKTVGRWVSGKNAPNFHGTMDLLELSGWLTNAGLQAYGRAVKTDGLTPQVEADAAAAGRRSKDLQERRRQTGGKR